LRIENYDYQDKEKKIKQSRDAKAVVNKTEIKINSEMKEKIRALLEDALPLVDFDSDFLFSELDSLGITTILMTLSDAFDIQLEASDATPRNLKSLDSIVALVESKREELKIEN